MIETDCLEERTGQVQDERMKEVEPVADCSDEDDTGRGESFANPILAPQEDENDK